MKILAIGAHADDIELSCGGTLANFIKNHDQVGCILITSSDYTNYNKTLFRSKKEVQKEAFKGLKILGIKKIWELNVPTKQVTFNYKLIEQINKIIDTFNPDIIISHHLSETHQDHYYTIRCVLAAARYKNNIWMFEPIFPQKSHQIGFKPMLYINISKTFLLKINSLKAHKSQWKKYPYWKDLITSLNRLRGIENQCHYAECFEPIKLEYKICP